MTKLFLLSLSFLLLSLEGFLQEKSCTSEDCDQTSYNIFLIETLTNPNKDCSQLFYEFSKINRNYVKDKESFDITKNIISEICSEELKFSNTKFKELLSKESPLSDLNFFFYVNYVENLFEKKFLFQLEGLFEKIFNKTNNSILSGVGHKSQLETTMLYPIYGFVLNACYKDFYLFCHKSLNKLESYLLDLMLKAKVYGKNASRNITTARYLLLAIRLEKISNFTNLGIEFHNELLLELKKVNAIYFYSEPGKLAYKELSQNFKKFLKIDNLNEEQEKYLEGIIFELDKIPFDLIYAADAVTFKKLLSGYGELASADTFPTEEYKILQKHIHFYLEKLPNGGNSYEIVQGKKNSELEFIRDLIYLERITDTRLVESGQNKTCDIIRNKKKLFQNLKNYRPGINNCSLGLEAIDNSGYKNYLASLDENNLDPMIGLRLMDSLSPYLNLFLKGDLPNESIVKKIADIWFENIDLTLNKFPDNTKVSLEIAASLNVIYNFTHPASFDLLVGESILKPSQFNLLDEKIRKKFFFDPKEYLLTIKRSERSDIETIKGVTLELFKRAYFHLSVSGLIDKNEDKFINLEDFYHNPYKIYCAKENIENICQKKYREAFIYLSRFGSEIAWELNQKIRDFFESEEKTLKNTGAPELFNRNVYRKEFKDLRHWTLFFMELYFHDELHTSDEKSKKFKEEQNASNKRIASLFIQNSSLENYSRIMNAFQKNKVLKKYKDSEFAKKIISYDEALDSFLRLKEYLINRSPDEEGIINLFNPESLISNKAREAREAADEIFFHKDEYGFPMFDKKDFSVGHIDLNTIQNLLEDDEVILLKSFIDDGPGLHLTLSNTQVIMEIGGKRTVMKALVRSFEKNVKLDKNFVQGKYDEDVIDDLELLDYHLLWGLGEIDSENNSRKKVYVISDDNIFQKIPFSALRYYGDESYAFEKYDFVYLDSLGTFVLSKDKKRRKLDENLKFTAFANPKFGMRSKDASFKNLFITTRGLKNQNIIEEMISLPETEDEALQIAKYFRKSSVFTGDNASEEQLIDFLSTDNHDTDVLTLATHAFSNVNNYTLEHGFAFAPTETFDGFLISAEIRDLNLTDAIVILSACDTDKPLMITQDSYSGFIRAFIEAGAQTILYTTWNIDSESAKIFMTEALRVGVASNLRISEAISRTMKKFAYGDFGEEYRHPFYWAPYRVFGVD